jgi:simple sugar transport system permease protein
VTVQANTEAVSKRRFSKTAGTIGAPLIGAIIGLLIGAVLILIAGANPLEAYRNLWMGAFGGQRQITETILKTTPLLIVGLGLTAAFRVRVWNIGGEGQFVMGALMGGLVALYLTALPRFILIPVMLLAGMLGGALWALIPAFLKIKAGMSEIISTLMLNYIAIFFMEYLARGPLQEPGGYLPVSAKFDPITRMPVIVPPRIHLGFLLALILVPLVYVLLWKTPLGFRLRAVGSKASVARYAGIHVEKAIIFALMFSGALAGLAGIVEVSAIHTRLKANIVCGYGFDGILVALLGRMHPVGVLIASVFFAALCIGSESMHAMYGLPVALADSIQAIIVLSVLAVDALARWRSE